MERQQHTTKDINCAILATRNDFIGKYRRKQMGSQLLTYEPALDREVYQTLKTFQDPASKSYQEVRNNLNSYTEFQVETFIGERLNVGLSEFRYTIKNGKMYGQGMDESLIDMIQRGRDCRDVVANDVDKPRQDAEIEQFQKIEQVFGDDTTKVGTTIISISPPGGEGSNYAHNFYDVFVLSEDKQTKERFVAAHRYASELSVDEYKQKAEELVPGYLAEHKNQSIDSYFLSHPLVLDTKSPLSGKAEKIHEVFHRGHEFLSTEDFHEVKRVIAGLVASYVNTLCDTPEDELFLNHTLNAIMNRADAVADSLRRPQHTGAHLPHGDMPSHDHVAGPVSRGEIMALGSQPVRQTTTGCGSSGGFGTEKGENRQASNLASFSSADFGKDSFGSRTFHCPECGETNIRPENQLLSSCQHCGSEKVAC